MNEATRILRTSQAPDNDTRAARASAMLLELTDRHGSRAAKLAEALNLVVDEREEMAGVEDLARVLLDHVHALAAGVEQARAVLDGRAGA